MLKTNNQDGFSAVELLVTLMIGALFVTAFYQVYTAIIQGNAAAKYQAVASDIAYSNLRKYTTRPSFSCDANTDLVTNPNAPGQVLSTSTTATPAQLPGPLVETVTVFAPRGCDIAYPVRIDSSAQYGSPAKKVVHSSYVN